MKKINKKLILVNIFVFLIVVILVNNIYAFQIININPSRDIAISSINDSEKIISEMIDNNLPYIYMNDSLIEAKKALELADSLEIINQNINSTKEELQNAIISLKYLDIKNISYDNVLIYTNSISERKNETYNIYDSLTVIQNKIKDYKSQGYDVSEAESIFNNTNNSFYKERFSEVKPRVKEIINTLETKKSDQGTLNSLKLATLGFFGLYWYYLILVLFVIAIFSLFVYQKSKVIILKNKINKLRTEKIALNELIKRNQTDRFKDNKISGLVYKIRAEKYQKRIGEIKQELPVIE